MSHTNSNQRAGFKKVKINRGVCLRRSSAHYFQGHGPRFSASVLFLFFFFAFTPRTFQDHGVRQGRMTEPRVGSGDALMPPQRCLSTPHPGHAGCGSAPLMGFGIVFIPAAKTNREHSRETIKCYQHWIHSLMIKMKGSAFMLESWAAERGTCQSRFKWAGLEATN